MKNGKVIYDKTRHHTTSTPWFDYPMKNGMKMKVKLSLKVKNRITILENEQI